MKRNTLKVLSALGLLAVSSIALASCGDDSISKEEAKTVISNFDSSINTTVKLTYNAAYNVDVNANGGSADMSSFKHQIRSTTEIEMDLGQDLYLYTKKTAKDLLVSNDETVTENLLYKSGDAYYYQTSSTKAVEVAASEVRAKINEIISSVTGEQAGSIDLGTLQYTSVDKSYELSYIGLSNTFTEEDLNDPTYKKNDNNGLNVEYKAEYVGYQTDGGISDFSNSTDGYAATLNLETNDKGYVTSWKETYNNASLDFAIMTPAPTVSITGERNFVASYGDSITKISSVDMIPSTASLQESTGGSYSVFTCVMGDFTNMSPVTNGASLEFGKVLCVKPSAAEGKEVSSVTVNGSTTTLVDPAQAGGFYCFYVIAGENTVVVEFKDSTSSDDSKEETKEVKWTYNGKASNNIEMNILFYTDGTFDIKCPGYNNAVAVTGSYTLGSTITLNATSVQYFTKVSDSVEFSYAANFSTISCTSFFNGDEITFTFVSNN